MNKPTTGKCCLLLRRLCRTSVWLVQTGFDQEADTKKSGPLSYKMAAVWVRSLQGLSKWPCSSVVHMYPASTSLSAEEGNKRHSGDGENPDWKKWSRGPHLGNKSNVSLLRQPTTHTHIHTTHTHASAQRYVVERSRWNSLLWSSTLGALHSLGAKRSRDKERERLNGILWLTGQLMTYGWV